MVTLPGVASQAEVADDNDITKAGAVTAAVNLAPSVVSGAANASINPVNRYGSHTTTIQAVFTDNDQPGINAFTVTFKIREPDNATELILVDNLAHGVGGLTITDNGLGNYVAKYSYDPDSLQTLGLYDLYFSVSDGTDNAVDDYVNNLDELEIVDVPSNNPPVLVAGGTTVLPVSVDRFGGGATTFSAQFGDADGPGISAFYVRFKARSPFNETVYTIADGLQHGVGGLTITDDGGNLYTASISWDPPDNALLGYYDLYCDVYDGIDSDTDFFDNNSNELLISNGGENSPPVVPGDAVYASPAGIERIGANTTTLSATFSDGDSPGIGAFAVTFKVRDTNNVTEIVLADNAVHGTSGVTITDDGGGIYTAFITWDPADGQTLGYYDLYFHVTDGVDTSYDGFHNNLDELEVYDAVSNNVPTLTAGNTFSLPTSVNRIGTGFTMLKSTFSDVDEPGAGAFTVTFKVRDPSAGEITVAGSAKHGEQGVRIVSLGSGNYEAAVLWDPDVAQPTGDHDLYFSVTDNNGATAIDDYASNSNELTVTSAAVLGDGHLLRRDNDSTTCGGPGSACHNLPEHESQGCRVCHTPHGTSNIYLVRDTIQTPNSGPRQVIFKTLGIGDPYNDPDPVVGDPNSGVMADSTDGVFTGVCEVCHTTTAHHRNDGSQPPPNHNDAVDCTGCHSHDGGFAGGESGGGSACSCHNDIFTGMDSTAAGYHHILANIDADYSPGASGMSAIKNCLTCHVDHDIFRPDLNTGIGQRAKNLRVSWDIDPVQGSSTVLSNSDYSSSGSGGICLSCHSDSDPTCGGCHSAHKIAGRPVPQAASTFSHRFLVKADYDAATSTHNYIVSSTFSADGSTFNGNCVKCHNDTMMKAYQGSSPNFSLHGSDYDNLLDSAGISTPVDPLEEEFCFKCHSTTSNPNSGSNLDYFGVKSITNPDALDLETALSRTYTHPTATYQGRHSMADSAASFADGNRHAECVDCHNPHAALQGTHDGSSSLASNALKGTWGVEPSSWPAAPTPTDNGNVFAAPSGYTAVRDNTVEEWMICMKCHSNYTTLPTGKRNLAEEINPNYPSTHGITIANQNPFCNTTTMNEPWGSSGLAWCSDCHRSDNSADPEGPHGSNQEHLLVATVVSDNSVGTPLCLVCHKSSSYWTSGNGSRYGAHPGTKGAHKRSQGCFACHMWDYSSVAGLGVSTTNWSGGNPPAGIFVHGMNKKWVYNEVNGSSGTGQDADAFVSGYIANMDFTNKRCWSTTCKNHSDKGY